MTNKKMDYLIIIAIAALIIVIVGILNLEITVFKGVTGLAVIILVLAVSMAISERKEVKNRRDI